MGQRRNQNRNQKIPEVNENGNRPKVVGATKAILKGMFIA